MSDIRMGISLFSLAHPYKHGKLSLEDCLKLVSEMGYETVELVSAQMVKGFPEPDDSWCADFRKMTDRYGLEPFAYGCYVDNVKYTGRNLTSDEGFYAALRDLKTAAKLGFKTVKSEPGLSDEAIRRLIPIAKSMGIWFGIELHTPDRFNNERWRRLFHIFDEYGPNVAGVVPDMGMFAEKPNKLVIEAQKAGVPMPPAVYDPYPISDLEAVIPYSRYMHGKCFYINEELEDESIDFGKIFAALEAGGFAGPLACEYEGYFTNADEDSIEQVRRFAGMFRKYTD